MRSLPDGDLGPMARQERQLEPFEQVRLEAIGHVVVVLGDHHAATVEAPAGILDEIETRVEHGTLCLGLRPRRRALTQTPQIRFEVTARSIRGLAVDGRGEVIAPALRGLSFEAQVAGHGRIAVDAIDADALRVGIDGRGAFTCPSAKARKADLQICGAGTVGIEWIEVDRARISIDGKGDVTVSGPLRHLAVDISGSGVVTATRLESDDAAVRIDGRGRVTLAGGSARLSIRIDGRGDVDARDLAANSVEVSIDGVGKSVVKAKDALDVRMDGFGRVEYIGDPKLQWRALSDTSRVVRVEASQKG